MTLTDQLTLHHEIRRIIALADDCCHGERAEEINHWLRKLLTAYELDMYPEAIEAAKKLNEIYKGIGNEEAIIHEEEKKTC